MTLRVGNKLIYSEKGKKGKSTGQFYIWFEYIHGEYTSRARPYDTLEDIPLDCIFEIVMIEKTQALPYIIKIIHGDEVLGFMAAPAEHTHEYIKQGGLIILEEEPTKGMIKSYDGDYRWF